MKTNKPLIMIGAGGHAKVLLSLVKAAQLELIGVCAPELASQNIDTWRGVKVLGSGDDWRQFDSKAFDLINAVGQKVGDGNRERIFHEMKARHFYFPPLTHPLAYVDPTACLEEGVQVMAGTIIQADANIGKNSIVNTHASIDHDCILGEHSHVAPGAVLCGNVVVGKKAFIASGAVVVPGISIGECALVGAGASVVRNVKPYQRILPALIRKTD